MLINNPGLMVEILLIAIALIQNVLELIGPAGFKGQAPTAVRCHPPGVRVSKTQNAFGFHGGLVHAQMDVCSDRGSQGRLETESGQKGCLLFRRDDMDFLVGWLGL